MAGKAVAVTALALGCGVFAFATWKTDKPKPDKAPDQPARQVVAFEPLKPGPTLGAPGADPPQLTAPDASATSTSTPSAPSGGGPPTPGETRAAERRAALAAIRGAPILVFSQSGGGAARSAPMAAEPIVPALVPTAAEGGTELDQLRKGSTIGQARATRLPDRNFLIVAGSALPCTLQMAMDTATPGYVNCLVPRDVYSDNGAVILMEKGTRVLGEYRSSLRQGQRRLFVLWTRAVTPAGVAISLASPAADALGRAGFDGDIDTHFWDRFGAAFLLSIVDDGTYALVGRDAGSASARLPSDAAGIALQNSVNIPPSLRRAQGSEVSIFVAQDFDFSSVYALQAR
ncbi:MAG: hypothetical protein BGN86_06470 [Caulobacterales bacterium 68-7]|nr:MAG: hypothetical protein BGN86_06470 [Caulobacterales bacterium 68-7]